MGIYISLCFVSGRDGHQSASLFERGWLLICLRRNFFIILLEKGVGTYSSIWEGMVTNLFFGGEGMGVLSTVLIAGMATNLFFFLEGVATNLPFLFGRGLVFICFLFGRDGHQSIFPFRKGRAFIYFSIWKGKPPVCPSIWKRVAVDFFRNKMVLNYCLKKEWAPINQFGKGLLPIGKGWALFIFLIGCDGHRSTFPFGKGWALVYISNFWKDGH